MAVKGLKKKGRTLWVEPSGWRRRRDLNAHPVGGFSGVRAKQDGEWSSCRTDDSSGNEVKEKGTFVRTLSLPAIPAAVTVQWYSVHYYCVLAKRVSLWYNRTGWLGVKHQVPCLLACYYCFCYHRLVTFAAEASTSSVLPFFCNRRLQLPGTF